MGGGGLLKVVVVEGGGGEVVSAAVGEEEAACWMRERRSAAFWSASLVSGIVVGERLVLMVSFGLIYRSRLWCVTVVTHRR